jgi:malonate transporter
LCIALSRLDGADLHGAGKAFKSALKGVVGNPLPRAILLGALALALHLELPQPVAQTVGLLADAASPVALFPIGAVLARSQMLAAQHKHPLLAERFGADNGRIARIILVSTAGALVTFPLAVSWLG